MRGHENILIFGRRGLRYFPQGLRACERRYKSAGSEVYRGKRLGHTQTVTGYPVSVLRFARDRGLAPCEKPVALLEYLVRTYTRRGELAGQHDGVGRDGRGGGEERAAVRGHGDRRCAVRGGGAANHGGGR